jgi:hypothetical protein
MTTGTAPTCWRCFVMRQARVHARTRTISYPTVWFDVFAASLLALIMLCGGRAHALEPGDDQYPNSIITPEPGAHRPLHAARPLTPQNLHHRFRYAHGSSGSVLPSVLPKTRAIPPEGGGIAAAPVLPQQQGPTFLPNGRAIPNLPHGPETFQDRASRCAHQQALNNIPSGASTQYMAACL